MSPERITRADIDRIKREHILDNLLYSPQEVATILGLSVRSVFNLIDSGRLTSVNATPGAGRTRITARSVEVYRVSITG